MPSITVWKCSSGSRYARDDGRSASATGCCGVPANVAPTSVRHHASFVRASAGSVDFVDDVVDLAAEGVERGDRAPALRRQEQEAVVEARCRSARPSAGSTRRASCGGAGLQAGRWRRGRKDRAARDAGPVAAPTASGEPRKTSPPVASMPSRMRCPPASTPRDLERSRHGSARVSGRPDSSSARARADLERHQGAPRGVAATLGDLRFGDAEARRDPRRKVDAALGPVGRDVLPEIDELQRRADRVARGEVRRRVGIEDAKHQAPDRIRRAPAVVEELCVGSHSASSSRPGETPRAGRGTVEAAGRCRAIAAASSGNGGAAAVCPLRWRRVPLEARRARRGAPPARRRLRRRSRRRCARSGRSRGSPAAGRRGTSSEATGKFS